ncbi:AAA family ATPase [Vulcanisaeta thermophila]|uniref:AAA family ATPase n=1 Tax=Vulcanisaeta thermophila TaxID=867917 RepID=UPI000852E6A4|nr:AAA family ATPase [Vulcanisaeta thermophila]
MRLVITGTPGVGKTTLASELSKALGLPIVKVEDLIHDYLQWDPTLLTNRIVNVEEAYEELNRRLREMGSYIVDTVAVDLIDPSLIDWCVVLRLDPRELLRRLLGRGWPWCKVVENVFSEVIGVLASACLSAVGPNHVIEVNTTGKDVAQVVNEVLSAIAHAKPLVNSVDWLELLDTDFLLNMEGELDKCRVY